MSEERDNLLDRRRLKKKLMLWQIAALGVLVIAAVAIFSNVTNNSQPHIARITVAGTITESALREKVLSKVAEDKNARAVIVRINSPGGTVAGSEGLYNSLRKIADNKPVASFISTIGASGGYIAAMATDQIYARQNSITGSIGVIFQTPEFSGALDFLGVSVQELKSDELKGGPSIHKKMSDTQREVIQQMVDDSYDWFVGIVAERRNMEMDDALVLADGRVFSGTAAAKNGLVDAIGGEEDALAWLHGQDGVTDALPVIDVTQESYQGVFGQAMAWLGIDLSGSSPLTLDGLLALWQPM